MQVLQEVRARRKANKMWLFCSNIQRRLGPFVSGYTLRLSWRGEFVGADRLSAQVLIFGRWSPCLSVDDTFREPQL